MKFNLFLICLIHFLCTQQAFSDSLKDAEEAFHNKNYKEAAEKYLEAEINEPDNLKHTYNRAVSQYMNKDFEDAIKGFTKSARSKDPVLSRNSKFNLGNSLASKGDFEEAKKVYDEILNDNPNDKASKENKDWVEKIIKEMKKQQNKNQDQQNQDQKNQDQKNQDQQNQDQQNQDQKNQDQKNQDQQNQDQKNQDQQNQDQQNQDQQNQDQKEQSSKEKQDNSDHEEKQEERKNEKQGSDGQTEESNRSNSSLDENSESLQDINKADAEKLLRLLEDREEYFGKSPKLNIPHKKPERDW